MLRKILSVALVLFTISSCTKKSSSDDDDDDIDAAVDGDGSVIMPDGEGAVDSGPTADASYAPCAGCCDPIYQAGCAAGEGCYKNPSGADTRCEPAGTGGVDAECDSTLNGNSDCMPGTTCVARQCHKFCLSDTDCPTTQRKCARSPEVPYGVCLSVQ